MQVKDSVLVSRAQTTPTKMGSALPIFAGMVWARETNSVYVHVHVLLIVVHAYLKMSVHIHTQLHIYIHDITYNIIVHT